MACIGNKSIASQQTVEAAVGCHGIGLHSGEPVAMTLRPAAASSGIVFRRVDIGAQITASWRNTVESVLCTVLSDDNGVRVGTIEHLMAALGGSGIDNVVVELDGPEVPIMDGSAGPFLDLIRRAGRTVLAAPRRAIKILKPVRVTDGDAVVELMPDRDFSMSFEIDFANPLIRRQELKIAVDEESFRSTLSRARTFGLLDDVDRMRAAGLARGGSLENAVVVSGDRVLNHGGLRYADEFVRHKLLDAYGDLYLAGGPIVGRFRGRRSGHAHTRQLLTALFADRDAWCYTSIASAKPAVPAFLRRAEQPQLALA